MNSQSLFVNEIALSFLAEMAFKESRDIFGGVTVRSKDLRPDQKEPGAFSSLIARSLEDWKKKDVQGLWMKVHIQVS